jgi:hypothetical protein
VRVLTSPATGPLLHLKLGGRTISAQEATQLLATAYEDPSALEQLLVAGPEEGLPWSMMRAPLAPEGPVSDPPAAGQTAAEHQNTAAATARGPATGAEGGQPQAQMQSLQEEGAAAPMQLLLFPAYAAASAVQTVLQLIAGYMSWLWAVMWRIISILFGALGGSAA